MAAALSDANRYDMLDRCLACGFSNLTLFLDLGHQPLANDYHDGAIELAEFPLAVNVCQDCWHSQLTVAVDPSLMFRDYAYVSGTTKTLSDYFDEFVGWIEAGRTGHLNVLDIAGNDGSLLAKFAQQGHHVLNVDPAENLTPLAEGRGVTTLCEFWGPETYKQLDRKYDVIVAMNVLAHGPDPLGFLQGCRNALADGGQVYVQTSMCEMIETGAFDNIYAEHASYFTAKSFLRIAARAGLHVQRVAKVPVAGTSYLWTLGLDFAQGVSVPELIDYEERHGYYDNQIYNRFNERVAATLNFLSETAMEYAAKGYTVVAYGATAKLNTVLNAMPISELKCIVDDNPLKVGLLTPGCNIPIVPATHLQEMNTPLCVIISAWHFYDEVVDRIRQVRSNSDDRFVRYFPEPSVSS